MRIVIQRVDHASVSIEGETIGKIRQGMLVLLGVVNEDTEEDVQWLANKMVNLRIFDDEEAVPNCSLLDVKGDILLVSQFTLHARTKKGHRPSYIDAARPEHAIPLYERMKEVLEGMTGREVQTGKFGHQMEVELLNKGPHTIIIDSKDKH